MGFAAGLGLGAGAFGGFGAAVAAFAGAAFGAAGSGRPGLVSEGFGVVVVVPVFLGTVGWVIGAGFALALRGFALVLVRWAAGLVRFGRAFRPVMGVAR